MAIDYEFILGVDPGETTGFLAVQVINRAPGYMYCPIANVDTIAFPRKGTPPSEMSEAQLLSELYYDTLYRLGRVLEYADGRPVLVVMDSPVHTKFANYFAYELRGVVKLAASHQACRWVLVPPVTIQKAILGGVDKISGRRKKRIREFVTGKDGLCLPRELAEDANAHDVDAAAVAVAYCRMTGGAQ